MRAIARRLRRLEERNGPAIEDWRTLELRARLEAARLRSGLPPTSGEPQRKLTGLTIVDILNSSRRASAPELDSECHSSGCFPTVGDLLKHAPLLIPVDPAGDGPKVSLIEAAGVR
jgi:hypothetical protein